MLLDAVQRFQNTAFGRARLAHVYTVGEGHGQRIDRLYVHLPPIAGIVLLHSLLRKQQGEGELRQAEAFKLEWSEEKSLPARLSGKIRVIHTLPPHLERTTMEAVHKSLDVSHVWITKFVKLPKDTVGSFIMTFNTDAVADLLGVEEANAADRPQNEGDPEGVSSSQADIQPSNPSSPTSHVPSASAGPSSGPEPTISQVGTEGSEAKLVERVSGRRGTQHKYLCRRLSISRIENWCAELLWP